MSQKFVIQGGKKLEGEIEIRGYKNAAGAILAASLLTEKEVTIGNLPLVEDVNNTLEVLKSLGAKIDFKDETTLRKFISSYGKIVPRRRNGVCSKHQRKLALAIKRARILGILPFTNK